MNFNPFTKARQFSISDLQDEMNRMFDRMWHQGINTGPLDGQEWAPPVDVIDHPDQFVLTAEVAGLGVENIAVSFEQGELIIKGHKPVSPKTLEGAEFLARERRGGNFCRRITLPCAVNHDAISATCRDGLLEIVLPKKESATRQTIEIKIATP